MANDSRRMTASMDKYKLSRRGKKLQLSDDLRTLVALPKDVPERTWAEILRKEETDLMILDIREEIIDSAMEICYEKYMTKQKSLFTANCAAKAWIKLINWYFFRHDPGEEPSAYPQCHIPKRLESWIPDELPDPSPKDTWCKETLNVVEEIQEESLKKWPSNSSIDLPVVEDIPEEYWFPGKIKLPPDPSEQLESTVTYERRRPLLLKESSNVWAGMHLDEQISSPATAATSELLAVTDYSVEDVSSKRLKESSPCVLKRPSPAARPPRPAAACARHTRRLTDNTKVMSKSSQLGRSKGSLPPLDGDSRSRLSIISDCRLRSLRLDTQYEITSEKIDTPPGEPVKRK